MKVGEGENEKKFDLFTWNLSTSYNWRAAEYKLGDLSQSLRASPTRSVSFDFRTTHSFYQVDEDGNRIDRLYMEDIGWWKDLFRIRWARLTYLSANLHLRLKRRAGAGVKRMQGGEESLEEPATEGESLRNVPGDRLEMDEGVSGFDIPWNLTATLSYTENRYNPLNPSKTFWTSANLDFNLTKHWKISYRARFDLKEMVRPWDLKKIDVVSQDLVFYRDLHCWEARVVWTPTGYYKRFYFRINVKSPMLREIKVEKGTGRAGIYGY
jgi:hypothetical protein